MEIAAARPADAHALAAVLMAARRSAMPWLPELHDEPDVRGYMGGHVIPSCEVLVARDADGEPVAFLALAGDMVEHLYVHPGAQRAGLGTVLLEAAKARRPNGLRLWVFQRNEAARAFYARHGFTELQRTDGTGNEEREPDVLLGWTLAGGQ